MKLSLFNNKKCGLKIFLLFFAFYFLLTRQSTAPLIYPDEAGYIGWAYKILYGSGSGLRYLPGYSILLIPIFFLFGCITTAFTTITALNAVLSGLFAVCVFKLTDIFKIENRLLVTLAVCLYPAVGLNANFAMCESLLCLTFVLLVIAVHKLSENINSGKTWCMAVALAAYLCITHSRAIAILPAVALALLPAVYKSGRRWIKALYFTILTAGFISALALVVYLFGNTETVNAAHLALQIRNLFTKQGIVSFIGTLCSQFSYLILSTYGFIAVGIYYTVKMLKEYRETALFMLLSFSFTALLSAVFMYHHENPAHILYGRYNEYTIYVLLMVGIGGFLNKGINKKLLSAWAVCVFTAGLYRTELTGIDLNLTHTWGIYLYKLLMHDFSYVAVLFVFATIAGVIFAVAAKSRKSSVIILCCIFGFSTVFAEYDYFVKGAVLRQEFPQLAELLKDETEIQVNASSGDSMVYPWEYFNYTVYNAHLTHSDDASLILSVSEMDETLIGAEKYSHLKLYSKSADKSQEVDLSGRPDAEISADIMDGQILLNIKNNGRPWLCKDASDDMRQAVRAGIRVFKDGKLEADLRCDFTHNVYDTACAVFDFPYPDGEYTIITETVREFIYRGGEAAYTLTKHDGTLSLEKSDFSHDDGFSEFDPLSLPQTSGFYRYYVTEDGAEINNIQISGEILVLETFGEHSELSVDVIADEKPLEFIKYEDGCYFYRLGGTAENLRIISETYQPCDNFMTFLTTESNFKPVDLFVRGMKKVFGIRLDHRRYGVDIQKIKTLKEDVL